MPLSMLFSNCSQLPVTKLTRNLGGDVQCRYVFWAAHPKGLMPLFMLFFSSNCSQLPVTKLARNLGGDVQCRCADVLSNTVLFYFCFTA